MKPLMKPIDTPDQVFHDGDPSTGELGTICSAEWLNDTQASIRDIQAECIAILRANGFEPDETKREQLWEAIQAAIKNHVPAASLVGAGIVQLSSSVTSDSETIAATLKAVKIAMDNGNARMAKDRNGSDIPNKALFRQNLELGNSATCNVGTTTGTVVAGDDVRITGAMQKAMNGSDIPDKAAFCRALGLGALATSDGIDALIKSQNGADIPDKALFVQNLGLTETVTLAKNAVPSARKVNGRALTQDINVTSQDIFDTQSIPIDANQNLDNYQTPGLYVQYANANTSTALNYPESLAGALMVLKSAGITQVYYVYNSSRIWTRSKYGTAPWTPWAREYNTANPPPAPNLSPYITTSAADNRYIQNTQMGAEEYVDILYPGQVSIPFGACLTGFVGAKHASAGVSSYISRVYFRRLQKYIGDVWKNFA